MQHFTCSVKHAFPKSFNAPMSSSSKALETPTNQRTHQTKHFQGFYHNSFAFPSLFITSRSENKAGYISVMYIDE